MRQARIFKNGVFIGILKEEKNSRYSFEYKDNYQGDPISLTMPTQTKYYIFESFPPFFEGLLPEGYQLEKLLKNLKIDKKDYFSLLIVQGADLIGDVTVKV